MTRLKHLARLLVRDGGVHYISNGRRRIFIAMRRLQNIIPTGSRVLDIGGHNSYKQLGYSFQEYTQAVVPCQYFFENRNTLDIRKDPLPYEDDTFDVVISSESIEHFWLQRDGGMISWEGLENFWKEAHRVLKPNGIFFCSTRNRSCVLSWMIAAQGEELQVAFSSPTRCGHVRELSALDFRRLAIHTGLFQKNKIETESSIPKPLQSRVNNFKKRLENFLGKPITNEQEHDTIFFTSKK